MMSQGQEVAKVAEGGEKEENLCDKAPGFCSATCMNRQCMREAIKNPFPKTSDVYATCNLPKRFEHPHWFNGYGSQVNKQHPFYRTSASVYGWFPPGSCRKPWTKEKILEVINNIQRARITMNSMQRRTSMEYYWMSKYDIMSTVNGDHLIFKRKNANDPTILIIPRDEYFDVLKETHISCGHGGRDKILQAIKRNIYIPKKAVEIFVGLCPTCETKKHIPKKSVVTHPIVSQDFNIRGQVDLIDFQSCPSGEYKWLLNYQDNATKFLNLRPLKSKDAHEVAEELLKIFTIFGAPYILQSDNGREFTTKIIEELSAMWPECKIVHGSCRRPQTQESDEKSNQEVENMLRLWMSDNKSTNWALGCFQIQYQKNISFNRGMGRSPYKALFGNDPKAGLSGSNIPPSMLMNIETEEQLKDLFKPPMSEQASSVNLSNQDLKNLADVINSAEKSDEPTPSSLHENSLIDESGTNPYLVDKMGNNNSNESSLNNERKHLSPADESGEPSTSKNSSNISCEKNLGSSIHKQISNLNNELDTLRVQGKIVPDNNLESLETPCEERNKGIPLQNSNVPLIRPEDQNLANNFICVACHIACTSAHSCILCKKVIHVICGRSEDGNDGSKPLCYLCRRESNIQVQRNVTHKGTKRAADEKVDETSKKLRPLV